MPGASFLPDLALVHQEPVSRNSNWAKSTQQIQPAFSRCRCVNTPTPSYHPATPHNPRTAYTRTHAQSAPSEHGPRLYDNPHSSSFAHTQRKRREENVTSQQQQQQIFKSTFHAQKCDTRANQLAQTVAGSGPRPVRTIWDLCPSVCATKTEWNFTTAI